MRHFTPFRPEGRMTQPGSEQLSARNFIEANAPRRRAEEVPAIGLAELFERERIDRCGLLKCDLEGAEYDVFEAAPPALFQRIDRLVIEAHQLTPRLEEPRLARLRAQLRDAGLNVTVEPVHDARGQPLPWLLLLASRDAAGT